ISWNRVEINQEPILRPQRILVHRGLGQERSSEIRVVTRLGHDRVVASADISQCEVRNTFLRADERDDFGHWIEGLPEAPLHESRDSLAVFHQTQRESITAHGRNTHGFRDSLYNLRRGRQIRVAGPEVDDVYSASNELAFLRGNSGQRIFREAEYSI